MNEIGVFYDLSSVYSVLSSLDNSLRVDSPDNDPSQVLILPSRRRIDRSYDYIASTYSVKTECRNSADQCTLTNFTDSSSPEQTHKTENFIWKCDKAEAGADLVFVNRDDWNFSVDAAHTSSRS